MKPILIGFTNRFSCVTYKKQKRNPYGGSLGQPKKLCLRKIKTKHKQIGTVCW